MDLRIAKENLIATDTELMIQKSSELMRINQDLDRFVYTASHELRSPISNMEGLLNAMTDNACYKDKDLIPLFAMMNQSVEELKKTIHKLTEINSVQKFAQIDIQEIALEDLIEEMMFRLRDFIISSKANIEIDIVNCLVIKFSITNLKSIVYNFLSNALKYQSPERIPEILIKSDRVDGYYVLIVQNNGLGILKEHQTKLFSWFKLFHDHVEGTGIGLYMVKRIIDNAGGKIEVESEPGKGSTFKIFLKS